MSSSKIINRKCVLTNKIINREFLIRIVKTNKNEFFVDSSKPGRGAYVFCDKSLVKVMIQKKILNRVFRSNVPLTVYHELASRMSECENVKKA